MSLIIKTLHLIFILSLMPGVGGGLWTKEGREERRRTGLGKELLREPQPLTTALYAAERGRSPWTSRPQGLRAKHMAAEASWEDSKKLPTAPLLKPVYLVDGPRHPGCILRHLPQLLDFAILWTEHTLNVRNPSSWLYNHFYYESFTNIFINVLII